MSRSGELSELCGALVVTGFTGPALDADTARALAERRRAGVILFRRNVQSVDAVHAVCSDIARATTDPEGVFVAVDQEGGRVARIPAPAITLPPMRVLGDIDRTDLTRRAGLACGKELAAMGFNVDFAPVLDVDSNPQNPVIGDRSFGSDPECVARHGIAFAEGLQAAGVLACGKHFPGHGDTDTDSHLALPRVRHARERLDAIELLPFRRAGNSVGSLMTAHVVYDALDPAVPATQSPTIVTDLLRRQLGYEGLVFSDDLEMRAVADRSSVEESAILAVRAGCDVLLVCKDQSLADRAHEALVREAERDRGFRVCCEGAAQRSRAARRRFPTKPAASRDALKDAIEHSGAAEVLQELASVGSV
jgi:beta-N-acetylhexosaminidase